MHPSRLLAAGLSVALLVVPAAAGAYSVSMTQENSGKVVRWPKTTVPFWLHPSCSTDLPAATCLAECKASFQAWLGHPCSALTFTDAGTSANKQLTSIGYNANGKNEVAWIENGAWTYSKFVLGVTSPYFFTTGSQAGAITEADIAMNGYLQTWSVSGKPYSTDVRNVLVHEIGHFFGLQHVLYPDSGNPETMAPTADPFMKSRTPEQDDINGLCYLYPKSGSFPCTTDNDCPYVNAKGSQGEYYAGRIGCSGGVCGGTSAPIQAGGGKLGDVCASSVDCDQPLFCQPLSGAKAVCSQACSPQQSGSCPSGFKCYAYQGQPAKGACIQSQGGGGSKGTGEACSSHAECKTGMCVPLDGKQVCQQPCQSDAQCGSGQKCALFVGKSYGACVQNTGGGTTPTKKADGEICSASAQCQSSLCVGSGGATGLCTRACTSSGVCGAGKACVKLQSGKGACLDSGSKKLGQSCGKSSECADGLCLSDAGQYVCSKPCATSSQCPSGYACYQLGGGSTGGGCFKGTSKKADGQSCKASSECSSGLCVGSGSSGTCVPPCKVDAQCGPGYGCVPLSSGGGACFELGDKKLGQSCSKSTECASGKCVGLGGSYVCAATCGAAVDCPCGFQCKAFTTKQYCVAGDKIACIDNGKGCAANGECVSGRCLHGSCVGTCSVFTGTALCDSGKGCVRLDQGKPTGVCSTLGQQDLGTKCGNDTYCKSLFCYQGKCDRPCNPFGPNTCGAGLVCEVAAGAIGHCTTPSAPGSDAGSSGGGGAGSSGSSGGVDAAGSGSSSGSDSGSGSGGGADSGSAGAAEGGGTSGADGGGAQIPSDGLSGSGSGHAGAGVSAAPGGDNGGCSTTRTGVPGWGIGWLLLLGAMIPALRRARRGPRPCLGSLRAFVSSRIAGSASVPRPAPGADRRSPGPWSYEENRPARGTPPGAQLGPISCTRSCCRRAAT